MASQDKPVVSTMAAPQRPRRGNALMRLIRYRLHIPLLRSPHPPEYTARGVMMGMIWAFIPLFGVQMGGVLLTWTVSTRLLNWQFAIIPALAFIWITNIFTIVPTYYVYYVTGQALLGHWSEIAGYDAFAALFASTAPPNAGFLEAIWAWIQTLLTYWGVPIVLGSIPWTILMGWLGYRVSLNLIRAYRRRREQRMARAEGGDKPSEGE